MIWKDARSELEIDHRNPAVIVGGRAPNLMINTTVSCGDGRSTMFLTAGPYATWEEAKARAETMAAEHGIGTIYRIIPLKPFRSSNPDENV